MRDPLSRSFSSFQSSQESWLNRVRDNFHQLLTSVRISPSSANGTPIHLLRLERSPRGGQAQSISLLMHTTILGALALLTFQPPNQRPDRLPPGVKISGHFPAPSDLLHSLLGRHPSDGSGSGSGHGLLPPTQGNLPPPSSIQLLKPTLPENPKPEIPIPPTILDASAPRILMAVDSIGLPWMSERTDSPGNKTGNTIGEGPDGSIGSSPGDQAGRGPTPGFYQTGVTLPKCAYCPDPQYTDEAREAKLQGTVTLQVLVGTDGRASQIHIVKGIGLGLDDRAAQSIRGWKFVPARDAAHRAVPAWVTIEAVFRLF